MLPRSRRVTTPLFGEVLSKGKSFYSPHFTFRFIKGQAGLSRFSVAVSKKVAKRAVLRNRFKRRTREALKKYLSSLPVGIYGVFFVKESIEEVSFQDLITEVGGLFKKVGN